MRWNRSLWLFAAVSFVSGCIFIPLPAPSLARLDDRLGVAEPRLDSQERVLLFGRDAAVLEQGPLHRLAYLPVAYCTDEVSQQNTIRRLRESMHAANQTLLAPESVAEGMDPLVLPEGTEWRVPDAFFRGLSEAHVRYVIYVNEDNDTMIHLPFWLPGFGVAACGQKTTLTARLWEWPSERYVGSVSTSAAGEFVALGYLVNLFFTPSTQAKATSKLADDLVRRIVVSERE
jgi:hypothetical protein